MRLAGDAIDEVDERGNRFADDTLLILLNAHHESIPFTLPAHKPGVRRVLLLDTKEPCSRRRSAPPIPGDIPYLLEPHTLALFCLRDDVGQGVTPSDEKIQGGEAPGRARAES